MPLVLDEETQARSSPMLAQGHPVLEGGHLGPTQGLLTFAYVLSQMLFHLVLVGRELLPPVLLLRWLGDCFLVKQSNENCCWLLPKQQFF